MNIYKDHGEWYIAIGASEGVKLAGGFPSAPLGVTGLRECSYVGSDTTYIRWDIYTFVGPELHVKVSRSESRKRVSGRHSGLWTPEATELTSIEEKFS